MAVAAARGARLASTMLAACLVAAPAQAARSAAIVTARSTSALVAEIDSYRPGQPFRIALQITAAPGWHTYWHNPGDAGAAPEYALTEPAGVALGPIAWPLPHLLPDGRLMSFGYTGTTLFARSFSPPAGTIGPLKLVIHATWLICQTLCVPESAELGLTLPPGPATASVEAAAFIALNLPHPAPWPAHIAGDGTLWLTNTPATLTKTVFLPDASDTTTLSAPQRPLRRDGVLILHLAPTAAFRPDASMSGLLEAQNAQGGLVGYTLDATPAALPPSQVGTASVLLLALLGGLLLNLMPCVFPVLAMKALSLAALAGADRTRIRIQALSYTVGVLVAFLLFGAVLVGLRRAGMAAGWGFQFQSPVFVTAMAWLMFVIGLNFSGAYAFTGMGLGQRIAVRAGHAGSFGTGLLAVLVATPCTAPFMGGAIAAAAVAPPATILLIFLTMGFGLAVPTMLLAASPGLAAWLPRPGRWMELLRQALAFPLYAAAVWLIWVLSRELGSAGVLGAGAGLVLLGFGLWAWGVGSQSMGQGRRLGHALGLAGLLASLAILPGIARIVPPPPAPQSTLGAEPYSVDRLAALRAAGQPVLVNMTAAWCITCLVNEAAAIRTALPRLAAHHVVYLVGDWTRQDVAITAFLHQFGRDGVPLYVFYSKGGSGDVLPQVLTPAMLAGLAR